MRWLDTAFKFRGAKRKRKEKRLRRKPKRSQACALQSQAGAPDKKTINTRDKFLTKIFLPTSWDSVGEFSVRNYNDAGYISIKWHAIITIFAVFTTIRLMYLHFITTVHYEI